MKTIKMDSESIQNILIHTFLILFGLSCIYPFFWVLLNAFKTTTEIYTSPFAFPSAFRFDNFVEVFRKVELHRNFLNSMFIVTSSVALLIIITGMAAYIIARFWKSNLLLTFFTLGIMVPGQALVIPTFIILNKIGLVDSQYGLILVYTVSNISLAIFILVPFIKKIPFEIEESGFMDGASNLQIFTKLILPLAKPGLATIGTLNFILIWNEYLYAFILLRRPAIQTLTQAIFALRGTFTTRYGLLCAGITVAIIPVVIVYSIFQDQIIKGMYVGSVKG